MGNEIECCRRPQGLGKKDLKTYKGPQKNKVSSFKTPTFDAINDYEKRRAKKKGFDQSSNGVTGHSSSYLDSIYENKNNYPSSNQFHDFSKFNIEPVSEPNYTPQANIPEVQAQQNISDQYKNGSQYVKSHTLPPQSQEISTPQYMDTFQNTQYTQSAQPQLQQTSSNYILQDQNNYVKTLPTNYVSSQPEKFINSQPNQFSNLQNGESNQPIQYSNSQNIQTTQPIHYDNAQNSESSQPFQYAIKEPTNYVKNTLIQNQYIEKPQTQYIESSSTPDTQYTNSNLNQYMKAQPETYTNYNPQIEYTKPEAQVFSQYLEPQTNYAQVPPTNYEQTKTQYIEAQPDIQQTKYIQVNEPQDEIQYVKPKSQNRQYIEVDGPQDEIQYIKPKSQKRKYIEVEEPEDEIQYVKSKSQKRKYIEVEGPQDEIQYVKPKTQKRKYIEVEEPQDEIQYIKPKTQKRKYIEVEEPQDEEQYVVRKPRIRKYIEVEEPSEDEIEYVERQPQAKQYVEAKPIYKESQNVQYFSKPKSIKVVKKKKKYIEREQYMPDYQSPDEQYSPAENNFPKFQQEPQQYDLSGMQQQEDEQYMDDTEEGPEDNKHPIKILPPKYLKVKTRPVQYIDSDEQSNQNFYYEEEREEKYKPKYSKKVNQEFSPDGYKRFYPSDDPFFKRPKGKKSYKIYNEEDEDKREIYEGEMMDGKKHGFGKLTTKDYIREGTWKEDKFTGWGRESRTNGEILEGRFVDGKVEGKGILRDSKGSSYIGDFVDSKREGFGELDTKKANYKGEFKDNKFNGHGKVKIKEDGSEIEAEFRNGDIEKERNDILNGGKVIKSANIEKKEESHACQVPGFISSFFSKIFD